MELINPQLEHAGWYLRDHSKVKIETPVDGYDAEPWNGSRITRYTVKMGKCRGWYNCLTFTNRCRRVKWKL